MREGLGGYDGWRDGGLGGLLNRLRGMLLCGMGFGLGREGDRLELLGLGNWGLEGYSLFGCCEGLYHLDAMCEGYLGYYLQRLFCKEVVSL